MMECKIIHMNDNIKEAIGWIQNTIDDIEINIFYGEKPCPPYDIWIEKMREANKTLESILVDEAFKKILAEEEKQYDIDDDKADGQSY